MQTPFQLTFRHVTHSDAIEAHVRQRVEKLERYSQRMISCHVTVDAPPKHSHHGKSFHVVVDVSIPGRTIDASRSHDGDPSGQNMYLAIDDAFAEVERQLVEQSRKRRHARDGNASGASS